MRVYIVYGYKISVLVQNNENLSSINTNGNKALDDSNAPNIGILYFGKNDNIIFLK